MRVTTMNLLHILRLALILCVGAALAPRAIADDIDVFLSASGASADAPNVIFLIDNSANWSKMSQGWPNTGNQGLSELAAISSALNAITAARPVNVGLAFLDEYAGAAGSGNTPSTAQGGGYIRFGVRDMTNAQNKAALQAILAGIPNELPNNIDSPAEKVAQAKKDEDAGFYEIYKYLSGLTPYTGPYGATYAPQNVYVDVAGNPLALTGAGQGLTSGFAINGGQYVSPISSSKPCARTYIIYIANNAQGNGAYQSGGQEYYQQAIADAAPLLPGTLGMDTWTDEWTKFLYTNGVRVPAGNTNGSVVTYILDAWNKQQNVGYSNSLQNAAKVGGGKYFQVNSQT